MEQQYSQFQFQAEFPSQEKPRKNLLVWILIPIIVLGIGVLGILAARIWDPLWNPFRPRPEKVLERMVSKMKEAKTLESETNLFLELANEGVFSIEIKRNQKEDKREPENPKSETSFELSFIIKPQTKQGEPSFGLGGKIFLAGEIRSLNKKSFLRLTTIPGATELGMMGTNLLSLKNQWIKVDNESIVEFLEALLDSASGLAKEELPPAMVESYKIQLKQKIEEQEELQKEVESKIRKEIENSVFGGKFLVVKKQLPDEKIDNLFVYHYLIVLNNEELLNLAARILKIMEEMLAKELGFSFTVDENEFKNEFKKALDKIGEIGVDVWIGKKDYYLYKISGEKTLDFEKISPETGETGKLTIKATQRFYNFNSQMSIEEPKGDKSLKEVLLPIFEKLMKSMTESQRMFRGTEEIYLEQFETIPRR